ncbi:trihelix transcription factor ENAP1-like [Rhododendron vialii]|uniref:trihelix transcription factor ENAP1-like n=1 Tax=Rhododendron vialii TaxID=182163 RepID=UPI00265F3530|nr:trihelix transcription factor ENAP1-like [Rhododendron vialii]
MDDSDDDTSYRSLYRSPQRPKLPVRDLSYPEQVGDQYLYGDDDDYADEEDVDEEGDDNNEANDSRQMAKFGNDDDEGNDDNEDEGYNENDDEDENEQNGESEGIKDVDLGRHRKKRKLKSLLSSYEFAPRVAAPPVVDPSTSKPSVGGRNSLSDWTEDETFVLLDAWGERFLKHGGKSLRSEEWQEVAEKVNQNSKIVRTDTQCRNRLDTLKKKYKKEKAKLGESKGVTGRWVYFSKMDLLMSSKQTGLSCGVDSGEYVFTNPNVSLNRASGLDEMRDSPVNSESGDDSDGLPPKRVKMGRERSDGASFRLLADSIHKFSDIYEKIENRKRQQMVELEKMRMDFQRDLEVQKRKILERAHAEIAKIRQGDDDEENDLSAETISD